MSRRWCGWAGVHLDQGQPELAEPLYTRALVIQPRAVSALFGLGQAALARREYARAVDQFEQALAADPRESIAHYPLALAYRGLGNTAQAEAHLRQQGRVEVGPPDPLMTELRGLLQGPVAEENRGIRAMDGGDFKTAAEHFRRGLELAPDNPSLRHKLGTALSLAGDTSGAFEQFQETIKRTPDFAQAYYSLGVLLAISGRTPGSHRALLGRCAIPAGLRRGAASPRRVIATDGPPRGCSFSVRAASCPSIRARPKRSSDMRWHWFNSSDTKKRGVD